MSTIRKDRQGCTCGQDRPHNTFMRGGRPHMWICHCEKVWLLLSEEEMRPIAPSEPWCGTIICTSAKAEQLVEAQRRELKKISELDSSFWERFKGLIA